jgi:beta-lactamase superfamily II metal-dependent hydrolase
MRRTFLVWLAVSAAIAAVSAQRGPTFDVYSIDVEGGGATLFVSPAGESVLIDTGYQSNGRDAERIIAAAKEPM